MIVENRKARFEYQIEDRIEAGIVLEGWEVKSIRAKRVQLSEAYVYFNNNELFLIGCRIDPLTTVSSHVAAVADRTRKLLVHKSEVDKLIALVAQKGFTIVPLNMHYKNGKVKVDIALAKGKELRDKRDAVRERDWQREHSRLMKSKG